MITAVLFSVLVAHDTTTGSIQEIPIAIRGISPGGDIVLGTTLARAEPCIWTARGGVEPLDLGLKVEHGIATAASTDGTAIVGYVERQNMNWVFLWRKEQGATFICPNGGNSWPGVSQDGQRVFGVMGTRIGRRYDEEPFVWSSKDGLRRLQPLKQGETRGGAVASSFDGTTIVGFSTVGPKDPEFRKTRSGSLFLEDGQREGAVWINGGQPIGLGRPDGFFTTQATGCSSGGSIVCGTASTKHGVKPFTWSKGTGLVLLPLPSGIESAATYYITSDGKTVFGGSVPHGSGLVWRADFGVATLTDFLRKNGVDTDGWSLRSVTGISDDGRVIAGVGRKPSGESSNWVVTLPS